MVSRTKLPHPLALAVTLALAATPLAAAAQSPADSSMATLICRRSLPNETATATMKLESAPLVCRPFGVTIRSADGSLRSIGSVSARSEAGPNFAGALTADQVAAVWTRWVQHALRIDPLTVHTP